MKHALTDAVPARLKEGRWMKTLNRGYRKRRRKHGDDRTNLIIIGVHCVGQAISLLIQMIKENGPL
ncbi:hypothetical protein OG589_13445 [Sphaerisporangium sp. NBC_01403]|uniref:hypothetical protein n=1 Tax=Sphaerisporangium sp. NBC_01403 TaxID=2903599 RepID=UPI003255D7F3